MKRAETVLSIVHLTYQEFGKIKAPMNTISVNCITCLCHVGLQTVYGAVTGNTDDDER